MQNTDDFNRWFQHVSEPLRPWNWQRALGATTTCRDRLIRIPTGLGKTVGVLAAWSFHRIARSDQSWPKRLVWCLPMRVLVEQTEQIARNLTSKIPPDSRPEVHVIMGGNDSRRWYAEPEKPAILIGTQDMLLSRVLNRGYAMGRAAWPRAFGLLNTDSLWVMDEVQLMGVGLATSAQVVGLATSAQVQAFGEQDAKNKETINKPRTTWWMSATLQPGWLESPETKSIIPNLTQEILTIDSNDPTRPHAQPVRHGSDTAD